MKRFLSTTAVILAMGGTAYAESHTGGMNSVEFSQGDFYASDLIGMRIYNSETEVNADEMVADGAETEWDDIGEINDIIVSADGEVRGVILGVGGFLGVGERDVSVSMDAIKIVREEGDAGERFLVVNTTKEALENQPEYERDADAAAGGMNADQQNTAASDTNMESEAEQTAENAEAEAEQTAENMEAEAEETAENMEAEAEENDVAATEPAATTTGYANLERPQETREGYAEAEMSEIEQLAADDIEGSYVYGANDETVGEIDALLLDGDGKITEAVINVGGFLGIGEKPVAVGFDKIQVLKSEDGSDYRFYIDSTEEKLESMQEYND